MVVVTDKYESSPLPLLIFLVIFQRKPLIFSNYFLKWKSSDRVSTSDHNVQPNSCRLSGIQWYSTTHTSVCTPCYTIPNINKIPNRGLGGRVGQLLIRWLIAQSPGPSPHCDVFLGKMYLCVSQRHRIKVLLNMCVQMGDCFL